jgi:hypothetical protein
MTLEEPAPPSLKPHAAWGRVRVGTRWVLLCRGKSWQEAMDKMLSWPDRALYPDKVVLPEGRDPNERPG